MRKVGFTETSLRDGHQSLMATRLTTEEIVGVVEKMDKAGYNALECWGGATFDSCIRFLNEDPWDRLREIKKRAKNTKLQMLLRGQNLLGYRHYADDVVEKFIEKSIFNGIDIVRIFDALNDLRNLETSIKTIKKFNGHAQVALSYTTSPIHTQEYFAKLAKEIEKNGADSICIKDMAGVLTPLEAEKLVIAIKSASKLPLELHTHATSGISEITYYSAVKAGVDIIDTAISPLSGGTSQPSTESINVALSELGYDTGLDEDILSDVADYFKPIRDKYIEEGTFAPKMLSVEPKSLRYQVPGGMLSNLFSQLKQANASENYEDVLKEVPHVRADLGYPPLVTPLSQMVGTQAVFNILSGERYKMIPKEIKDYVAGAYGRPPGVISEEIKNKIIGDREIITARPADTIKPELVEAKKSIGDLAKNDEDLLIWVLFGEVGKDFLRKKYEVVDPNKPIKIKAIYNG